MAKFIMIRKITILFLVMFVLSSCGSRERIIYFQNIGEVSPEVTDKFEPVIKPDDLLIVSVTSGTPEAAAPFNLTSAQLSSSETVETGNVMRQEPYITYLVDSNGDIQFPIIGNIKIGGLTKTAAKAKIASELSKYIVDPTIMMRIVNFKISLLGEVNSPGIKEVRTERITLPEAISSAGDMTINGKRQNVLIIREINGQKTYNYVDMTQADFMNTPFYYLSQNDVVVVQPNNSKIKNSTFLGANLSLIFSTVSFIITIVTIITR
jgi:polysaccharide export outer membrane protein